MNYNNFTPPGFGGYPYPGSGRGTGVSSPTSFGAFNDAGRVPGLTNFGGNAPLRPNFHNNGGRGIGPNIGWGMPYPGVGGDNRGTGAGYPTMQPPYGGPGGPYDGAYGGWGPR